MRVARLGVGGLAFDGEGIVPADRIGERPEQDERGALDTRQRVQPLEQRTIERRARAMVRVLVAEQNLRRDDPARIEAGLQPGGPVNDRARAGAGDETQRQGQLSRHEQAPQAPDAAPARHARARLAQQITGIGARGGRGRHHAEDERREDRDRGRHGEDRTIDRQPLDAGHVRRNERGCRDRPDRQ